jgi:myo-inositol-1(or 4)-monophosphatase
VPEPVGPDGASLPPPSPAELEAVAISTAQAARELIAACYGRARRVGNKSSPTDVVTQTDLDAEQLIRRLLHAATPGAGLLGEEGGGDAVPGTRLQWVIDPLDGTVNFLYGVPIFSVSIAAAVDGEIVAGAVVDVLRGEVFSAHLDGGAHLNGGAHLGGGARLGGVARLDGERLAVSACDRLPAALVATGFSYRAELRAEQGAIAHDLLSKARDIRCFGSAALELCWVACGRVDAYYERDIKVWDYSAGVLIAREAGAATELPCPENDDLVIAATPLVFRELRAAVQPPAA